MKTDILLLVFLSSLITIVLFKSIAISIGLLDIPNSRKTHQGSIPVIGGLAIFVGIAVSLITSKGVTSHRLIYLICSTAIVLLGVLDDKYNLPVKPKLIAQALITLLLCLVTNLYIQNCGNILGFGNIDAGVFKYVITLLAVIGSVNAFNMMDGIDGLLGSMALVSFSSLALLFFFSDNEKAMMLSLIFIAALLPYLANNLVIPPFRQKIFMGDAGSMLIGFTVVWLLMQGSQHPTINSFQPVTALWIIAIPLMDMAAIMIRRMRKGQSPFQADRDHLHHIFMRAGFSPRQTLSIITLVSIIFTSIGLLGEWLNIPEFIMFTSFLGLFVLYSYGLQHSWRLTKLLHKWQFNQAS